MKINTTQIAAFFLLVFSVTAGSTIYAMGKVNALNAALTLPTPAPLTNRPTIPPPSPSQISRDFLDHSIPRGYGIIKGKVIDDGTGAALEDARITIPELKLATRSNKDGNFAFDPIQVGTSLGAELDITLEAQVAGYGKHSMVNVGVFSQDTATVLLALKKGTAATNWFGLAKKGHDNAHAPLLLSNFSAPAGSLYFGPLTFTSSATSPPPYIRIGIMPLDSSGTQTSNVPLRVDSVDFNFYMKHVLGSEWYSTYSTESLKAGAMAVKNYGWYHVINPKAAMVPYGADCQNSTYCQVYNPYISYSSTDQAIGAMSTTGWYQNGAIFESGYCGGGASSGTSVSACGYEVNKCRSTGRMYGRTHRIMKAIHRF